MKRRDLLRLGISAPLALIPFTSCQSSPTRQRRRVQNPKVGGSNPPSGTQETIDRFSSCDAHNKWRTKNAFDAYFEQFNRDTMDGEQDAYDTIVKHHQVLNAHREEYIEKAIIRKLYTKFVIADWSTFGERGIFSDYKSEMLVSSVDFLSPNDETGLVLMHKSIELLVNSFVEKCREYVDDGVLTIRRWPEIWTDPALLQVGRVGYRGYMAPYRRLRYGSQSESSCSSSVSVSSGSSSGSASSESRSEARDEDERRGYREFPYPF